MSDSVWVVIPYAGEPQDRLDETYTSARLAHPIGGSIMVVDDMERKGLARALNWGRRSCEVHGNPTHICWLSTGDTLHPDRFAHPLPTTRGQCCQVYVQSRDAIIPTLYAGWQKRIYRDNQFCGSGMIVPVHIWDAVGGFDESLTYCSDWDFAVRVQHQFGWDCVPEVLATANEYPDGMTATADKKVRQRDMGVVKARARLLMKELTGPRIMKGME